MRFYPDADSYYEVGQWLPWVRVALTMGAAVVGKYHHTWHVYIAHYTWGSKTIKKKSRTMKEVWNKGPVLKTWKRSTRRAAARLGLEWEALKDFIKEPFDLVLDADREKTRDQPTVKYSFGGDLVYPEDPERNSEGHYQGPWDKSTNWAKKWKDFNVEFEVEADDHTLNSWQKYQLNGKPDEPIVYSVNLPTIPSYPEKRKVTATATVFKKVVLEPVISDNSTNDSEITLRTMGTRRASAPILYKLLAHNEHPAATLKEQSSAVDSQEHIPLSVDCGPDFQENYNRASIQFTHEEGVQRLTSQDLPGNSVVTSGAQDGTLDSQDHLPSTLKEEQARLLTSRQRALSVDSTTE